MNAVSLYSMRIVNLAQGQRWAVQRRLGVLLLVLLLAVAGYQLFGGGVVAHRFSLHPACDLASGPCQAHSQHGGMITLSITPRPIPLLQPLEVRVIVEGLKPSSVAVLFTGVDIDMGHLNYPLTTEDGRSYQGSASLSICSERRMQWQAEVIVDADGQRYAVPFLFDTNYRSRFKLL